MSGARGSMEVVHEKTDAEPRAVFRALLILLVATGVVAFALVYLTRGLLAVEKTGDPAPAPLAQAPGRLPPEPRLQTLPFADITTLRAEEQRALTSYGWVDEKAGVVRIPVERAMELLAQRGLPTAGNQGAAEPANAGGKK